MKVKKIDKDMNGIFQLIKLINNHMFFKILRQNKLLKLLLDKLILALFR
jgi:hypothetical protein